VVTDISELDREQARDEDQKPDEFRHQCVGVRSVEERIAGASATGVLASIYGAGRYRPGHRLDATVPHTVHLGDPLIRVNPARGSINVIATDYDNAVYLPTKR
jgi:hypothetical protein